MHEERTKNTIAKAVGDGALDLNVRNNQMGGKEMDWMAFHLEHLNFYRDDINSHGCVKISSSAYNSTEVVSEGVEEQSKKGDTEYYNHQFDVDKTKAFRIYLWNKITNGRSKIFDS